MQDRVNVIRVPISQIVPNGWNPNEQSEYVFSKEVLSIQTYGFLDPVTVREIEGGYEIVDGEHRYKAALQLGYTELPVNNLGQVTAQEATALTILMNEIKGKAETGKMSDVLKSLEASIGRERLVEIMPMSANEIENLIAMANFSLDSFSPTEITEPQSESDPWRNVTYRLPEAVANQFQDQVKRFKKALNPAESNLEKVNPATAIEAMCQHLAQIPDQSLI